jgi:hypothetical protein
VSKPLLAILGLLGLAACGGGGGSAATSPETPSGPFDLVFTGVAIPHAGQHLSVVVVQEADDTVVADGSLTIAADGSFSFSWSAILEAGESYHLDFFADYNGNGACDPPPEDHSWQESLGTITGPITYSWQHTADFVNVCARFN